ncbi:hypothetical protein JOD57_000421 [Geodermatophilus bullaregiensis]|uniref:hypothetical protein n=1 Tax=Geodermatophilus bullaregiensis TaxID=1564160 RepID=UPI0027DAC81D|nr:hypothetical protein [Geodermatophilus bullaregiensis]MBM7804584.1 hypothetical protein [Geodermatophilus bullaregiensis]
MQENAEAAPGRALVESGELVAGSMARTAAGLLFDAGSSRVQLDAGLAAWLRRTATAADVDPPAPVPGRARCRAGAALAFAVELSVTRAAQGRAVRTDGLLAPGPGDRARADELAEGVVLTARVTPEEWRVRHLGYLLAEAAVSPDLDAAVVGRGLRLATDLTARQWVLLAAVARRDRVPLPMTPVPQDPRGWTAWGALEDLSDLQRRGLLDPPPAQPRPGGAALPRLRPADLRLTRRGVLVHRLLALDFVRDEAVAAALAGLA